MSNVVLMSLGILKNLLQMEFTFKWPKNKFLQCFALIILVDLKAYPLAHISMESDNDLEEELFFTLCVHPTLFNTERMLSVNKVAPLSFKCKPS